MEPLLEMIQLAYKKLKGAVYLDKSQLPLIAEITRFEATLTETNRLESIQKALENENNWEDYAKKLLADIRAYVYPKKLEKPSQSQTYVNYTNEEIHVKELQYFIKAPVDVHILGVLWVMTVGFWLDQNETAIPAMFPHSYGNRLEKNLKDPRTKAFYKSPKLFVPYFSMYTSWRDEAIKKAREILENGKDAIILTMDLKRFFYSVHIPSRDYEQILCNYKQTLRENDYIPEWLGRLHQFVYDVMVHYSGYVRSINTDTDLVIPEQRVLLPIGFLPSGILSNWVLSGFDRAICDEINPVYYGRYVDDILIVDKVEHNSKLRSCIIAQSNSDKQSRNDIISHYFICNMDGCTHTLFDRMKDEGKSEIIDIDANCGTRVESRKDTDYIQKYQYKLKPEVLFSKLQLEKVLFDIRIQDEKVKTFYFKTGASMALLDTFEKHIRDNTSMFRMMPDMQNIFRYNDYSELFTLEDGDSPNKLNSVDNISISAYATSVFLGKYRKTAALIDDRTENAFEKDIIKIFDGFLLINQYILWERLLEIMIINENQKGYTQIVEAILEAIDIISEKDQLIQDQNRRIKDTLYDALQCAMARSLSLCWETNFLVIMKELQEYLTQKGNKDGRFNEKTIRKLKFDILNSRMTNRYVTKYPPDFFLPRAKEIMGKEVDDPVLRKYNDNLSKISAFYKCLERDDNNRLILENYSYRPYIIKPEEICYTQISSEVFDGVPVISKPDIKEITDYFERINGFVHKEEKNGIQEWPDTFLLQGKESMVGSKQRKLYAASVPTKEKKKKFRIALGSVNHDESYFKKTLQNRAIRSNDRYTSLSTLLNEAVKQKADILILPEAYMPFDWITDVTRFCAANNLMVITGIEHILSIGHEKQVVKDHTGMVQTSKRALVYNLTAVILPYQKDDFKFAHVVYHQKVYPSPDEKKTIEGYGFDFAPGDSYELYHWNDLWFNVQCCFELASISDRALFRAIPDLTVAVEWNRDVNYYSSIIESLSRDLHRYCAQVNISQYGDSRLTQPTKTETKDLIKMKGGLEPTVLSTDIDIEKLREFQIMGHELQTDEDNRGTFKPTPPDFDWEYTRKKIAGNLWEDLKRQRVGSNSNSICKQSDNVF